MQPKTGLEQLFTRSSLKRPDEVVGLSIWRLSLAYQRQAEPVLRTIGLTHLQFVILVLSAWLNYTAGEVNQRALLQLSGVQEAQISLMVKALKAKKLIMQRPSSSDPRARSIVVTQAGIDVLAEAIPRMSELQQQLWPEGKDTDLLLKLMQKTVQRWETE